jgi:hypothetical protein
MTTLLIQTDNIPLTVNFPAIVKQPELVTGDPELPGFGLKMAKIW